MTIEYSVHVFLQPGMLTYRDEASLELTVYRANHPILQASHLQSWYLAFPSADQIAHTTTEMHNPLQPR